MVRSLTKYITGYYRKQKLEDSLAYQQFCANVDEEESWIGEKSTLVSTEDSGDTLAAVQVISYPVKSLFCIIHTDRVFLRSTKHLKLIYKCIKEGSWRFLLLAYS